MGLCILVSLCILLFSLVMVYSILLFLVYRILFFYCVIFSSLLLYPTAGSNMTTYLDAKGTVAEASLDLGIETKSGSADFCTKVDIENEKLVIDGILKKFPNHEIIGEESVGTGSIPAMNPKVPTWIIDPIDGTTNFSAGLHSLTCVSIGYCVGGRPVMGVVYAPGTNELYVGVKGCGAYRNGQPIFQDPKQSTKVVAEAVICNEMGYARNQKEVDILYGAQARLMLKGCRAMRQLGSGCLDLCFVASGRLDVVYAGLCNEGWKPWDYAAGMVICQEAGCTMETIEAPEMPGCEGFDLYAKSVLCGVSKELVDEMRSVLLLER
mmetsp:Transcript_16667/g.34366  ORF Transcript_16667/g.34366 Transcript_16667/m.34366 type:complete len:323 (+) Transcript_16667:153-1121(+)